MNFERLCNQQPIIPETGLSWELEGMSNSTAILIEANVKNIALLSNIMGSEALNTYNCDAYVISIFTGNGTYKEDLTSRQYKGLAILTPELECIYKHPEPIVCPTVGTIDALGVEDARMCQIGDMFYLWYCGFDRNIGKACAAYSSDLLNWTKVAPLDGSINIGLNKDHLIFEEKINDKYYMLHRPWQQDAFPNVDMPINIAVSDDILGEYTDLGILMKPYINPNRKHLWLGGGPTPIKIGDKKYLVIYHTGSYFQDGYRQYDACAAIVDFNNIDANDFSKIVTKRLEPILTPMTEMEINKDFRIDIIFPMGNYVYNGYYYMIYGAGDKRTCAARVKLDEIVSAVEQSNLENPYIKD